MEKTQRERVLDKLIAEGVVDNFWAFHNYILRLGAIIHGLRQEGYEIDGMFGSEYAPEDSTVKKNFYYILRKKPHVDVF